MPPDLHGPDFRQEQAQTRGIAAQGETIRAAQASRTLFSDVGSDLLLPSCSPTVDPIRSRVLTGTRTFSAWRPAPRPMGPNVGRPRRRRERGHVRRPTRARHDSQARPEPSRGRVAPPTPAGGSAVPRAGRTPHATHDDRTDQREPPVTAKQRRPRRRTHRRRERQWGGRFLHERI
jgi:hypothetical protein